MAGLMGQWEFLREADRATVKTVPWPRSGALIAVDTIQTRLFSNMPTDGEAFSPYVRWKPGLGQGDKEANFTAWVEFASFLSHGGAVVCRQWLS